jgi:hypothetical protein
MEAIEDKLIRLDKSRLAQKCAKLDRGFESIEGTSMFSCFTAYE